MDIKIYWAGKCDAWFDRVRVENEPAHQYLTLNDQIHQNLVSKVSSEITWAANTVAGQIPNYFYFEECQFSHFPAIAALNKQIMDNSLPQNSNSLIIFLNYSLFKAHMPDCWNITLTPEKLKSYLHDDFGLKTIVMGSYPFYGYESGSGMSYHPSTLLNSDYNQSSGILSHKTSPSSYDSWLQGYLDNGDFLDVNKKMDYILKNSDMRIFFAAQTHLLSYSESYRQKEPSNEEIELQTDLALTYNAKGIMFFAYNSDNNLDSSTYSIGIMNDVNNVPVPRHNTVYNQDKFKKIKELSVKLNKWSPYLANFDNTNTNSYRYYDETERSELTTNSYFSNVASYKYGSIKPGCNGDDPGGSPPANLIYECKNERYLQVATFKMNPDDGNKYFMIINRRCSPDTLIGGDYTLSGKRFIRVRFYASSSEFANFNNWKIINLYNDSTVLSFDKTSNALLDLGWFMPGEGKLYKITPVIQ
jgi:hypothetical protein